jgi:hypothetical protein
MMMSTEGDRRKNNNSNSLIAGMILVVPQNLLQHGHSTLALAVVISHRPLMKWNETRERGPLVGLGRGRGPATSQAAPRLDLDRPFLS